MWHASRAVTIFYNILTGVVRLYRFTEVKVSVADCWLKFFAIVK